MMASNDWFLNDGSFKPRHQYETLFNVVVCFGDKRENRKQCECFKKKLGLWT